MAFIELERTLVQYATFQDGRSIEMSCDESEVPHQIRFVSADGEFSDPISAEFVEQVAALIEQRRWLDHDTRVVCAAHGRYVNDPANPHQCPKCHLKAAEEVIQ